MRSKIEFHALVLKCWHFRVKSVQPRISSSAKSATNREFPNPTRGPRIFQAQSRWPHLKDLKRIFEYILSRNKDETRRNIKADVGFIEQLGPQTPTTKEAYLHEGALLHKIFNGIPFWAYWLSHFVTSTSITQCFIAAQALKRRYAKISIVCISSCS